MGFVVRISTAAVAFLIVASIPHKSLAAEGTPVDQFGIPCLSMLSVGSVVLGNGAIRYNYEIKNTCDRAFSLGVDTNAGWQGLVDVAPGGIATWFCTDGAISNRDCNGGANSFEVK